MTPYELANKIASSKEQYTTISQRLEKLKSVSTKGTPTQQDATYNAIGAAQRSLAAIEKSWVEELKQDIANLTKS